MKSLELGFWFWICIELNCIVVNRGVLGDGGGFPGGFGLFVAAVYGGDWRWSDGFFGFDLIWRWGGEGFHFLFIIIIFNLILNIFYV